MESENRETAGTESLLGGSSRHVMGDYSRSSSAAALPQNNGKDQEAARALCRALHG